MKRTVDMEKISVKSPHENITPAKKNKLASGSDNLFAYLNLMLLSWLLVKTRTTQFLGG